MSLTMAIYPYRDLPGWRGLYAVTNNLVKKEHC